MHDNLYLHPRQIDKMSCIGSSATSPSSAYTHTLHVDVRILVKSDARVHYHNSTCLMSFTIGSFSNMGKYPWYAYLRDIECTKDLFVVIFG